MTEMKKHQIMTLAMMLLSLLMAVSCSEDDNTVDEFANWQAVNDDYFNRLSDEVKAKLAADPSRTDWRRIRTWSKAQDGEGPNSDYIIVHVLESNPDADAEKPLYTDTVTVSYIGRLLPTTSFPAGYVFDRTYEGEYDHLVSGAADFAIGNSTGNNLIDGFATALQNMRRGDHWEVYIPYQLGYGSTDSGDIPAYSTLIFDLRLIDFRKP